MSKVRAVIAELDPVENKKVVLLHVGDVLDAGKDFQAYDGDTHAWSDRDWQAIAAQNDLMAIGLERFGGIIDAFLIFRIHREHIEIVTILCRGSLDLCDAVPDLLKVGLHELASHPFPRPVWAYAEPGSALALVLEQHGMSANGEQVPRRTRFDFRKSVVTRPAQLVPFTIVEGNIASAMIGTTSLRVQPGHSVDPDSASAEKLLRDKQLGGLFYIRPEETELRDPNSEGWRYEDEPELTLQRFVFEPPAETPQASAEAAKPVEANA